MYSSKYMIVNGIFGLKALRRYWRKNGLTVSEAQN